MKEKTIEEIRAAVLAEYAEKLPQGSTQYIIGKIAMLRSDVTPRNFAISFYIDHEEQTQTIWLSHTIGAESAAWEVFYKLLGLEARDAVEAERENYKALETLMIQRNEQLNAERARAAKLVEALEEIAASNYSSATHARRCAKSALAAHKEGGANG